jgi:hypothetical protein
MYHKKEGNNVFKLRKKKWKREYLQGKLLKLVMKIRKRLDKKN